MLMMVALHRIKCLERDNAQKRILAEDMKMKMKVVQENVKSDAAVMVSNATDRQVWYLRLA